MGLFSTTFKFGYRGDEYIAFSDSIPEGFKVVFQYGRDGNGIYEGQPVRIKADYEEEALERFNVGAKAEHQKWLERLAAVPLSEKEAAELQLRQQEERRKRKDAVANIMTSTTSELVTNAVITENKGVITTSLVVGINALKDIAANFRDVFGGKSATYTNELVKAKQEALDELKLAAVDMGCNAIIGVAFDVETISTGSSVNMMMINVTGTAVKANTN
ncbi:YbjQ family protein [Vibrio sp. SM6]|uniref:UPF0145 protein HGP28_02275 n=1 Tax=Vibrio agarilyticus TaxID=2726741 RepID=A0A7X8TND4_9VIBR|nr:YbjQ family protein [Vibrio agarilyticus]NLS11714.1 YbjQ family protein [Vibrio agarilyticus]